MTNTPEDERGRVYDNAEDVHRVRPKPEAVPHPAQRPDGNEEKLGDGLPF